MDDREWARFEVRLARVEAALDIESDPDEVEREADLLLNARLMGWQPGMAMPARTFGSPDAAARWLAGAAGEEPR